MTKKYEFKAIMLLGTLKATPALSNTDTLCEVFAEQFKNEHISSEVSRLADYLIEPGIETRATKKDDWSKLLKRVLAADIIIFATPIWWGIQSSLLQRVIERMEALNDEPLETGFLHL
jgi:multimeric flavodoxin WrbA